MAPVKFNMESVQDNPPAGGFPKIDVRRGIKPRGPGGQLIWAGVLSLSAFSFFIMTYTTEKKRDFAKEKRGSRIAILPYFMAEHDLFNERKADLALARETEIMKHVDDWEVGKNVYSTRWTKPTGGR